MSLLLIVRVSRINKFLRQWTSQSTANRHIYTITKSPCPVCVCLCTCLPLCDGVCVSVCVWWGVSLCVSVCTCVSLCVGVCVYVRERWDMLPHGPACVCVSKAPGMKLPRNIQPRPIFLSSPETVSRFFILIGRSEGGGGCGLIRRLP